MSNDAAAASWRDPAGFVFSRDGVFYRQVNRVYRSHYDKLIDSGLYEKLSSGGLLLPHEEVETQTETDNAYKLLRPKQLEFISYPYEWCFGQLRDAALATLLIQRLALQQGMSLKDASAYNIQFVDNRPVLIDTLSFEIYQEGRPWVAYNQFCRHFLAPLALAALVDIRLLELLRVHIDGIPLDLASRLLPGRSKLKLGLLTHLHLHAKSVRSFEERNEDTSGKQVSKSSLLALIEHLTKTVSGLQWREGHTEWGDYYETHSYSEESFKQKQEIVKGVLEQCHPKVVWDLGANTGIFSQLAAKAGALAVAWDIDPAAVEAGYRQYRDNKLERIIPLRLDLTNPSPALGWAQRERMSLTERGPVDLLLALALVHHLAIGNNVPLPMIAAWFAELAQDVVIEFVPKDDPQVKRLLVSRKDIFTNYDEDNFVAACEQHFTVISRNTLRESQRAIFHMRKRD